MEDQLNQTVPKEDEGIPQQEPYRPRPWWQVWGARLLVIAFIILIMMYYITIARGGL